MAHIDTDEHRSHLTHGVRELHVVQIAANLAVDLLKDVCRLAEVEFVSISARDNLRRYPIFLEDFLEHRIVVLISEDCDTHDRVSEDTFTPQHHVVEQLLL